MSNTLLNHLYTYTYFSYQVSLFRKVQTWHKKGQLNNFAEALYCEGLNFHTNYYIFTFFLYKNILFLNCWLQLGVSLCHWPGILKHICHRVSPQMTQRHIIVVIWDYTSTDSFSFAQMWLLRLAKFRWYLKSLVPRHICRTGSRNPHAFHALAEC